MWFGVLGSLTAGQPPRPIEGRAERRVLAALLIDAGRLVTVDRLMDALWGDCPPRTAQASLQVRVSHLRRTIGRDRIASEPAGYRLAVVDDDVDATVFERLLADGRGHLAGRDAARAHDDLSAALRLWRGPAYADVAYEPFAENEAARLERLRLLARDEDVEARLAMGLASEVAAELEDAVKSDLTDERRWSQLMRALYRSGRQVDALRVSRQLATQLREIGLDPSADIRALEHAILIQDPELTAPAPQVRLHAAGPPASPANEAPGTGGLVGRADELALLETLLRPGAVVTLTGTGGVGKTALARAAMDRVRALRAGAATFVALDSVRDGADVAALVLSSIEGAEETGCSVADCIAERLVTHPRLLVLDNAEHVLAKVARLVERIVAEAQETCVLVTSREPLGLDEEVVVAVPCLGVADPTASTVVGPAVKLFVRRSQQARPGFAPNEAERGIVQDICERLDGLPLALELAAARLAVLSVSELDYRLSDRFRVLGTGRCDESRHDSLGAVMAWSFELLDPVERTALRRISVFPGGATLAALEVVCGSEPIGVDGVLDALARLVRKSLVVVDRAGPTTRYRLLDSVRAYAARELDAADERAAIRRRLVEWAVELARSIESSMNGLDEATWRTVARVEHANLLEALHTAWSTPSGHADFVELAGRLRQRWEADGRFTEAEIWLERALGLDRAADVHRVRALMGAGRLADRRGDWTKADRLYHEALDLARRLGEPQWEANALNNLSYVAYGRGDNDESERLAHAALAIAGPIGDVVNEVRAWGMAGIIALSVGDLDASETHFLASLEASRRQKNPAFEGQILANLGEVASKRGDLYAALHWNTQALAIARELDDRAILAIALVNCATDNVALGELDTAAELLDEADENSQTLAMPMIELAALACRARLLVLQGDTNGAIDAARRSTDAVLRHGVPHIVVETLVENATTVARLGETELARTWLSHVKAVELEGGQLTGSTRIDELGAELELGPLEPTKARATPG
jgi:predicted ATPase/DNA-binding SARP family transcriptional activator